MNSTHWAKRFAAILMVICILFSLAGCGGKDTIPSSQGNNAGTNATQGNNPQIEGTTNSEITVVAPTRTVKNVIFMIADGGGYDNFTLAGKVKEEMMNRGVNKLNGAKTEITNNRLGNTVNNLYLNEYLVGSANTLLVTPNGEDGHYSSYITDSSAAGTALSSGYKTTYCYAGIDSDGNPRASLSELARLNGMATGLVTTKSYVDATPLAFFTSHSVHRHEYQDNSLQALLSGIDVVIGEGTEYGDLVGGVASSHPDVSASSMGYTVAKTKDELLAQANNTAVKKLWAPILGVYNDDKDNKNVQWDLGSDHISYDVDAKQSAKQPSLLEMTQAALQVLGTNINDEDGFFLMIEGGALDNAAESGYLRPAIGEYLAFDEAFGYCVNWAMQRGDTIVIATADHDSGGFSGIENCEKQLIDSIITGKIGNTDFENTLKFKGIQEALADIGADSSAMALHGGHTDMAVPIALYAPDSVKNDLLTAMTLPTEPGSVRLSNSQYYVASTSSSLTWYSSPALNNDYTIDNIKIAPALAKILQMGSLDDATAILYNKIGYVDDSGKFRGEYGGSIVFGNTLYKTSYSSYYQCTYRNDGLKFSVVRNTLGYEWNGAKSENTMIGNMPLKSIFVVEDRNEPTSGSFFVPYTYLTETKQCWSVTLDDGKFGLDQVLFAKGTASITLPDTTGVTYTDGTTVYDPGDTVTYTGSDVVLTINSK